jgi:predicted KAP-like P-loop ATPase
MEKSEHSKTVTLSPPEMTILTDHPSRATDDAPDFLGLESRLAVVFDILRHKQTHCPVTVAVYGDWGTGKTSAMRWLETKLKKWNDIDKD